MHFEYLANRRQFRRPAAWAGSEIVVDVGGPHVERLALVVQEVDAADRPDDAAGPSIRTAMKQRRGPQAAQLLSQLAAKNGVFFVQMLFAKLVDQSDDDAQRLVFYLPRRRLRYWLGLWRFRRQRHVRHRQRCDDPVACLCFFEILVQISPDAGAEGNAVTVHQAVVDDHALERQQNCLRQHRQIRADQVLERLGQCQDAVGDGRGGRGEEHCVLFEFPEDKELARYQMPPGANDVEFVVRQLSRVYSGERLDQTKVVIQGFPNLEPHFRRQGGEFFRRGDFVGNHLEALVHEEHQLPVQPEEQFDFVGFE